MISPPRSTGTCAITQSTGDAKASPEEAEDDAEQDVREADPDLDQPPNAADSNAPHPQAQALQHCVTKLKRKIRSLKNIVQWLNRRQG